MLNFWVSDMAAEREERTALAEFELRAARARRFYSYQHQTEYRGSWMLPLGPP